MSWEWNAIVKVGTVDFNLALKESEMETLGAAGTERCRDYQRRIEEGAPAIMWRPVGGKFVKGGDCAALDRKAGGSVISLMAARAG